MPNIMEQVMDGARHISEFFTENHYSGPIGYLTLLYLLAVYQADRYSGVSHDKQMRLLTNDLQFIAGIREILAGQA